MKREGIFHCISDKHSRKREEWKKCLECDIALLRLAAYTERRVGVVFFSSVAESTEKEGKNKNDKDRNDSFYQHNNKLSNCESIT